MTLLMTHSEEWGSLRKAIFKAKDQMPKPSKDGTNQAFSRGGNVSTYATLDAVLAAVVPVLRKHGVDIYQPCGSTAEGYAGAESRLVHVETGEWAACSLMIALSKGGPHDTVSCTTYARRVGLLGLLAITADDDDGNGAQAGYEKRSKRRTSKPSGNAPPTDFGAMFGGE